MARWPSALPRWVRPAGRCSRGAFRQARSCARPAVVLLPQSQPAITAKPANPAKSAGLAGILRTACRRGQWGGDRVASASTPSLLGAAAWSGAGRRTVSRELSRAQGRARNRQAAPCRKGKGAQGTPDTQGTAQSASAREQPARAACASRLSGWKRTWSDGMPCRLRWHGEHPSLLPAEALAAKPSTLASGQSSRCACGCIRRAQLS